MQVHAGKTGWRLPLLLLALLGLIFSPAIVQAAEGDALQGERLFNGAAAMTNGGAPCIACHGLAGAGTAGRASFGPDLSSMYQNYQAEGVMAVLDSLAFPSMQAIYASRPLTEAERLDLTAYFAKLQEQPAPAQKSLFGFILLGVIIVFAIVGLTGLRRFKGARQPLVDQFRKQQGIKS